MSNISYEHIINTRFYILLLFFTNINLLNNCFHLQYKVMFYSLQCHVHFYKINLIYSFDLILRTLRKTRLRRTRNSGPETAIDLAILPCCSRC